MDSISKIFSVLLQPLIWSLASFFMTGHGAESDIYCLKFIKNSLDPFDHLSNWDFSKNTGSSICTRFAGVGCRTINDDTVSSLRLPSMGLKGQFSQGIENCKSLQTLDLSSNNLSGYIPSEISTWLPNLSFLDLSNNHFSGQIPKDLAKLSHLETLKLDGNQLTGQIPQELGSLPRIRVFSVANNNLSGSVPHFSGNANVSLSYVNNSGLCGGTLGPCDEKGLLGRSFWYSFVVGYVISATSVIVACMYYCAPWKKLKKRRRNAFASITRKKQHHRKGTGILAELVPLAFQEKGSKEFSRLLETLIPRMSYMELCQATDYFSVDNVIGLGMIGIMYKAKLPSSRFLAVKRLFNSRQHKREFLFEVLILGSHKHRNILPLHGFCIEKEERILVYKYMSNGRLSDWLQTETMLLEWPVRVHIALGIARGLCWLHKSCKAVHLNLNSRCVLLDGNFEPKISNFGMAKFINLTVKDNLRMELFLINGLGWKGSVEKDVHDFGIVLLELITGKILNPTDDSSDSVDGSLLNFISSNSLKGPREFYDVIDKSIIGKGFDEKIHRLLEVACECVKPSLEQRPKMVDLYKSLRATWEGFGLGYDFERLTLSKVYPMQTTSNNEIESIC